MARPGGMRGAIESAALVVDKRWRVKSKAQVSQTPSKSPPAALRIPPGRPKSTIHLDFVIFISLGTRRAKCKIIVRTRTCYEYASKMQASTPLFCDLNARTHFQIKFFQNYASCLGGEHNLQNDVKQFQLKNILF